MKTYKKYFEIEIYVDDRLIKKCVLEKFDQVSRFFTYTLGYRVDKETNCEVIAKKRDYEKHESKTITRFFSDNGRKTIRVLDKCFRENEKWQF